MDGERLSSVDRAWLLMERPTNPMMVVGLILLGSPLDRGRLRALIVERFLAFERFYCLPVTDPLGMHWERAAQFDLDDHVLRAALAAPGGQRELEALAGELASTPLTPARPLWTFHLVEDYAGGSALIVRIHHAYADGIALVHVLLCLTEREAATPGVPMRPEHAPEAAGSAELMAGLLSGWVAPLLREGAELLEKGVHYAWPPQHLASAARQVLGVAGELARLALLPDDPCTALKQALSGARRVAWAEPLSLMEVRTIGRVLGCTVNDVLVATLAGALGHYLERQGELVTGTSIRATVPVNLRSDENAEPALGNRFGLVFVELPIGIRHPLERLYAVHASMQALKGSSEAAVTLGLLALIGSFPASAETAIALFSAKASLVASNLPGPPGRLYMGGAAISQLLFWVPQAGSIGTGVSMLSYNGQIQFGVIADRALVPDPGELVELIAIEFERLVFLVLLGAGSLED